MAQRSENEMVKRCVEGLWCGSVSRRGVGTDHSKRSDGEKMWSRVALVQDVVVVEANAIRERPAEKDPN